MKLSEALDILTTTYQSLNSVAAGLSVDAKEVNDALKKVDADSAEYVALEALAKYNPVNDTKVKNNDNTSNKVE
jgi:hypothetical protein